MPFHSDTPTPDTIAMPGDVRRRCLALRKQSKTGGYLSPADSKFLEDCWKEYPAEYSAMTATVFEETKPFGSQQ